MFKKILIALLIGILGLILFFCIKYNITEYLVWKIEQGINIKNNDGLSDSIFTDNFSKRGILEETGRIDRSLSPYWWLNSGAYFFVENGVGRTIIGELEKGSKWQERYKAYNSDETDDGFHPQNIFRLVTRSQWDNFIEEVYFKIINYNLSASEHRYESNGVLLFKRYQDGNNLYYAGIRVDGAAVIKKKINGVYYTMEQKMFYNTGAPYNRDANPNLIPIQKWIGLRSEVKTNSDNTVSIKVFIDKDKTGNWVLAAEAKDDGKSFGGGAILNEGYAGIRTDFMDVEFDDYQIVKQ